MSKSNKRARDEEDAPPEGQDIDEALAQLPWMQCIAPEGARCLFIQMLRHALQPEESPTFLDPEFYAELRRRVREAVDLRQPYSYHEELDQYLRAHAGLFGRAMLAHLVARLSEATQGRIAPLALDVIHVTKQRYPGVVAALDQLRYDPQVSDVLGQVQINAMAYMSSVICNVYAKRPEGTDPAEQVAALVMTYAVGLWDAAECAHRAARRHHGFAVPDSDESDSDLSDLSDDY